MHADNRTHMRHSLIRVFVQWLPQCRGLKRRRDGVAGRTGQAKSDPNWLYCRRMSLIIGHTLLEEAAEHSADSVEHDNQYGTARTSMVQHGTDGSVYQQRGKVSIRREPSMFAQTVNLSSQCICQID